MLFQDNRHIGVIDAHWNAQIAKDAVREILVAAYREFSPKVFWPMPEAEKWGDDTPTSIYKGAMGVLWAVDYLQHYSDFESPFDVEKLAEDIYERYFVSEARAFSKYYPGSEVSSFLQGETGILLAKSKLTPALSDEIWERQYSLIEANIEYTSMESYWGGTGSVVPVLFRLEAEVSDRWLNLFLAHCDFMLEAIIRDANFDCPIWVQDLYGEKEKLLGAGHGYVGNMYPFLRGKEFLPTPMKERVLNDSVETVVKTARVDGDFCNWPRALDDIKPEKYLLQWCHGAPGVITSLNDIPVGYSNELDELLVRAGETIWRAGPLAKGVSICHGTNGNGYALLKLFRRTGDEKWLDRARAFATYAVTQSEGKFSLWDGDLGLAFYLHSCLTGDDRLPLLDVV